MSTNQNQEIKYLQEITNKFIIYDFVKIKIMKLQ